MDTKILEELAERTISSMLLQSEILLAKPLFDQMGGDLIALSMASEKASLCRIQCKYRDCSERSEVVIHFEYVTGAFVLFLYLKLPTEAKVVCLLPTDMKRHFRPGKVGKKSVLRLSLTAKTVTALLKDSAVQFTPDKVKEIKNLMKASSPVTELRRAAGRVIASADKLIKTTQRRARLEKLLLQYQVADTKMKSADESLEILQAYMALLERQKAESGKRDAGSGKGSQAPTHAGHGTSRGGRSVRSSTVRVPPQMSHGSCIGGE